MSGLLLGIVMSVCSCWFHNMVTLPSWLVSTDFGTWSYKCSLSNFTTISLHMSKCSWAHTVSCLFMYCSFAKIGCQPLGPHKTLFQGKVHPRSTKTTTTTTTTTTITVAVLHSDFPSLASQHHHTKQRILLCTNTPCRKRLYPFFYFFIFSRCPVSVESGVSCTDCY